MTSRAERALEGLEDEEVVYLIEAFDRAAALEDGQWRTTADLDALARDLAARFGSNLDADGLGAWRDRWAARVTTAGRAEATVHWLSPGVLKEEGIEMHLYGRLREVERELRVAFPAQLFVGVTIRRLRWWQMMLLTEDFAPTWIDVVYMAERFLARQLSAQHTDTPLYYDDLRAQLSYAPWRGGAYEDAYLRAIDEGEIPALRLKQSPQKARHAEWGTLAVNPASLLVEFGAEWLGDKPWRLLSQAFAETAQHGDDRVTWRFSPGGDEARAITFDWTLPSGLSPVAQPAAQS